MPWWGAVLIAVGLTLVGFAFDAGSGNKELTNVFGVLYALGCIAAVLAVRQQSVFTAVVQPPLILFAAVPGAYFLFHQSEIKGIKDILINCGYPLIERFLLMFTTSVIVLLIGMARWYFGASARSTTPSPAKAAAAGAGTAGLLGALKAKLSALTVREPHDAEHAIDRPAKARKPARSPRPTRRSAPTRSRHARPPMNDPADPAGMPPPRRRRPAHERDLDEVLGNLDAETPRRRPRTPRDPSRRVPPPEYGRDPRQGRPDRYDQPYDMPPPPPPRSQPNSTHHPVSRVRYRGTDQAQDDQDGDVRYRSARPRPSMDDWRYQG